MPLLVALIIGGDFPEGTKASLWDHLSTRGLDDRHLGRWMILLGRRILTAYLGHLFWAPDEPDCFGAI